MVRNIAPFGSTVVGRWGLGDEFSFMGLKNVRLKIARRGSGGAPPAVT